MWWLDPGKEVLNVLFNRILAPYVMNLDLNQVNYGIGQGQLTLRNLKLKKGALDKFQLPVDVLEGHLGRFTLSLHWMNLGNQPVEILIEDVYLLVIPSPPSNANTGEDEARAYAAKSERLENAELLHVQGEVETQAGGTPQSQGLVQSIIAKVINNVQVTVKNIHIRYEDNLSVPGHPFAAGITLAGFTAVSVNDQWEPAFIESTAGAIHKLAKLQSLALYFDTDSPSMSGLPTAESIKKFAAMISHSKDDTQHQYILKPVSGEGRVIVNHKMDKQTPQFDIQLLFEEIGVILDDHQYRDAISLVDMYHVYLRKRQYGKYRPVDDLFISNVSRARLTYAITAIVEGVREKNRKWTWQYFAERRDDRNAYVSLFQKKLLGPLLGADLQRFEELEHRLTYEDIRFYRSIARSKSKKDIALRKKIEADKKEQQSQKQGWGEWLWGSSPTKTDKDESVFTGSMTDEQRQQLYDVLDYDEKAAVVNAIQGSRESLKMRIAAKLNKGSFALKTDPHKENIEVMSIVFDVFQANLVQRPNNFEASISLNGFRVFDGTTSNTLYPQIVHVKAEHDGEQNTSDSLREEETSPFFFVKFENNPLDERADNALTVRMRHMEIIYHKGYVEAVYKFFKPPSSQLESVEALLNAASETLEGLRRETRAGLEYALQTHKTVDIQMDLNAPVIIIPEDVTTNNCNHLIIDAGHIAIESHLVPKEAIMTIHQKRNMKYTDEDFRNLESLMYDKLSLRLEDAQFIIGDNLQACREALVLHTNDALHILERISFDLQIEKSIVPTAVNIAQFKVSGKLPSLQVNLSDIKYKSLMRLIDVCIPHFGDEDIVESASQPTRNITNAFQLPAPLFRQNDPEYNIEDDDDDNNDSEQQIMGNTPASQEEQFFEADDGSFVRPELRQHIFEVDFQVDRLRAVISKSTPDGTDKLLGDLHLDGFSLSFALAKYHMKVDVNLSSVAMSVIQPGEKEMQFISTPEFGSSSSQNLLKVAYTRVQKESPDFLTLYEGVDQSVDIKVTTLVFHAAPEPVLALYDFIMSTFVADSNQVDSSSEIPLHNDQTALETAPSDGSSKIRVLLKLEGVQVTLMNDMASLATLSLSTADISVFIRPRTIRVSGRLGNLTLINDNLKYPIVGDFGQLMSIEGKNFADFTYQTYDPEEDSYTGVKSSVHLDAASIKFHFIEQPLHDLYLFISKLAKLKGLYDAATQVAVQRASEIERMQFEISIKSPIVILPSDPTSSSDALILRLGQIGAHNVSEPLVNRISASLRGIQLVSTLHRNGEDLTLKMIDDIDVSADIIQTSAINRTQDTDYPDTQIAVKVSDIRLHLTQVQYCLLFKLANAIPRVFAGIPDDETGGAGNPIGSEPVKNVTATDVDFQPELRSLSQRNWTSQDLVVSVNTIKLHLYDHLALSEQQLKDHGIARFALNDNTLRCKILSDGAGEAQVVLRSFTMSNTRPGQTKFREIIPAAQHNRNQFMLLYTMSSGQGPSLAVLTVDSPQIIFAVDPVISLLEFFTSAFSANQQQPSAEFSTGTVHENQTAEQQGSLDFRIDLHDVSISVLENDEDAESRAIRLYISHILLSQQGIFALTVSRLGMSLMKMGRATESVRFLDDVDLTVSLDNRSSTSHQMMNIEISAKPIVFRASYRDINMITSIVNRAIERYGNSQQTLEQQKGSDKSLERVGSDSGYRGPDIGSSSVRAKSHPQSIGRARVLISTEQLKVSSDGFRLVLIGDLHEQPMLHLKIKPFILGAKDWSGELHSTMTVTTAITYWNLTNSHWEPLIDPWTLTISVTRETPTGGIDLTLLARERLDLNISTTFMELALTTLNTWSREGQFVLQKSRGIYAPYRIRNQTGAPIFIWSDTDSTSDTKAIDAVKVLQSQSIDWRFDDWKTMREHVSSGQHNIGIQFTEESWEQLRGIPVDREGEYVFSLRPRHAKYPDRLLCEVKVVDNTKIVTLRSTYKVENLTLYPMELMLVDDLGHPVYSLEKIVPGQEYSLPIEAVMKNRIRLQPDQGFGYKWSHPIRWEDLISKKSFTVKCPHADPKEAAFRLQAWAQTDTMENSASKYPKINLKLRAPLELENLLPYNLEYRIYDKNTNQNWKSYLRKGGVMPVHSVELGHFILLNINVQETVFKPSEFTIINTDGHSDFDIEHNLTLRDQLDRTLDLKLNYVRHPESGGAFKVQIYSPYIVINKTGIPFSVKSSKAARTGSRESAGDTSVDALSTSNPFLLSHSNKQGHEFTFQAADSSWSQPISFEAPAAETAMVVASQKHKGDEYHLGLSWSEGIGKYKLTKVITITPRFLIKNGLSQNIAFREHGVAPRDRSSIEPGQRRAFYLLRAGNEKLLTVAYPGLNAQWSPPINMEDIGSVHFRLPRSGQTKAYDLVRADVRIEASTIFIFLKAATDDWPFIIENSSDYPFDLFQQDEGRDIKNGDKSIVYALQSHTSMSYAWDYPAARDKKLVISIGAARRVIDILEIGNLIPFKFNYQQRNKAVSLDVRADGQKQILRITNYNPDRSLYRPRPQRTTSVSISRQDTISSSVEGFEAVPEEITTNLAILIDLAGIGVSLINKRMVEVIYSVMDGIKLEYTNSRVAQSLNIAIGTLQVDNQLHEAIFPVILQPTPVPKEASGIAALPTIQASVIWLKDQEHGVLFIKYCSILLQALTIEVDEDLLFALYDLIQIKGASWEEGTTDVLIVHPHDIAEPSLDSTGQDLYFEVLELQPIKLSLSFMRTERVNSEEKLSIKNPLAVVVNALTMTVGNINDAPLEMNALAIKDMRLTLPELQSRIAYHYRQDILRQLYRILGSADFIGNPVGLFTNVSSGVADIFYEPFQGVVVHGNKELGIGIAKGAASFVKKTVFGVSDSVTKFTSSVGKGLSAATFDSEYQARRRMTQRRNKPRHAIYGVTAGGEAFASSVTSAMEGVFMKPIEGAESEGAFGFFKGVGKGLVGAVTKPVVGVFDLASNVSEGIRNTTTVFDNPDRDRVRQPRLVPADGVLRPYSAREALGQSWMKDINNGAYRREHYVAHINSPGGDNVVLLTDSRVLSLWSKKLRLDWELPFTQIQGVTVEDTGIRFAHKSGREQDKFAFIPDKAAQSWFFNQVASVVKAFNSRRRMDS